MLNVNEKNMFLEGYDVVAYFTANEAVQGVAEHSTDYHGAKFYFANSANLEAFRVAPEKYLPKYGGYCAFAVANGKGTVKSNPKTFKLYNGELLMFFNDLYEGKQVNTMIPWNADERALYTKAEGNWTKISH